MLKGYNVKLGYSNVYFFEDIAEASVFFDQAIRHSSSDDSYKWSVLEPVWDEVDDDGIIDGGDL